MRQQSRLAVVAISFLASACAFSDHFDNRVGRYDIAAEQARDAMILTNIIRASHAEPLSFVQLGQVTGSNTSSAQMGLPSLFLGPFSPVAATAALQKQVVFGASAAGGSGYVGNSASTSGSTNFGVTPQETQGFYDGLLREVSPYYLDFFRQQGLSRELLFYLFTDTVIENGQEIPNDPSDPAELTKFKRVLGYAMEYGLWAEPVPPEPSKKAAPRMVVELVGASSSANPNNPGAGAPNSSKDRVNSDYRLCFNKTFGSKSVHDWDTVKPICGSKEKSGDPRTVTFKGMEERVIPRSPFAMFQFLGKVVAGGEDAEIELKSKEAVGHGPLQDSDLFSLQTGSSGPCFLSVDYEGESYCVPLKGAVNTKRILSLLTQLIALNTTISEIPVTPTVQILP